MLTYLAIGFVLFLLTAILYGFGIVMRRAPSEEELVSEKCSICRRSFSRTELVERPIGDYKVLWFCGECIDSLASDKQAS